ncbi:MAG: hypothetical protein HZB46_00835 [Solirubrobacterales bacterium]|nr:hypothetical protein [Solirubrobacterales bacterium]
MARFVATAAALAGVLLVTAPGALGATATVGGDEVLHYAAAPGEVNDVRVRAAGEDIYEAVRVSDAGAAITPGPGCTAEDAHTVVCGPYVVGSTVDLGDGADHLDYGEYPEGPYGGALVHGGPGDDDVRNDGWSSMQFFGEDGDDRYLDSSEGGYFADGGPGDDDLEAGYYNATTLIGGPGDDRLTHAMYGDNFEHDALPADLDGGEGNDVLCGADGGETFRGGPGRDTVTFCRATAGVTASVGDGRNDGYNGDADVLADVEHLVGTPYDDVLRGGAGDDEIDGLGGADDLGGLGANDTLDGGLGPDVLAGGPGVDQASYATRTADVSVTIGGGAPDGAAGEGDDVRADVENVAGGSGDDVLTGNLRANTLLGGAGADTLTGGTGRDVLSGGTGADLLRMRDGYADRGSCGPGADQVEPDDLDAVGAGCETTVPAV